LKNTMYEKLGFLDICSRGKLITCFEAVHQEAGMSDAKVLDLKDFADFVEDGLCRGTGYHDQKCFKVHKEECRGNACEPFTYFHDNMQIRWLTGMDSEIVGERPILDDATLERAKSRLRGFDEVLILEEMHARGRKRLAKFGWSDLDDTYRGVQDNKHTDAEKHKPEDRARQQEQAHLEAASLAAAATAAKIPKATEETHREHKEERNHAALWAKEKKKK